MPALLCPALPFIDQNPNFCPFFLSLSSITSRAMLQGRVLTGMVTPGTILSAQLRRAERVNCSLGKTDQTLQAGK